MQQSALEGDVLLVMAFAMMGFRSYDFARYEVFNLNRCDAGARGHTDDSC
jgi:hypothetical protein